MEPGQAARLPRRAQPHRGQPRDDPAGAQERGDLVSEHQTWKHSTDVDFAAKLQRILALYDKAPDDGRVICVDEFGPLNLMPRPGKGWFPVRKPKRLRATFHRAAGVRHMFAALDLASGEMFYRIRDRKR